MHYRLSGIAFLLVAGFCLHTSRASAQAGQSHQDQPPLFQGGATAGFTLPDGRTVPLFYTATPDAAFRSPANVTQDEILNSVTAEGSALRAGMDAAKIVMSSKMFLSFTVNGKETDDMLLLTVHPQKGAAREKIFKKPVTFASGQVTRLAEAIEKFGHPVEIQLWSSESSKDLNLDGSVYWWGEVGVSASPVGAITHVLLRRVIKRE